MAAKGKKHVEENLKDVKDELTSEDTTKQTEQTNQSEQDNAENKKETENGSDEKKTEQGEIDATLQAEIDSLNDRLLRLQADFLNYKARTEKEKTSTYSNAVSDLILALLPVVDNFERALVADTDTGNSYKEGVQMVYDQLMGILYKKGLKEIEALHKPFDPNYHYGVGFEASDEFEDGTIIDVLQKGYTVNDRCIRPSMVRICKK